VTDFLSCELWDQERGRSTGTLFRAADLCSAKPSDSIAEAVSRGSAVVFERGSQVSATAKRAHVRVQPQSANDLSQSPAVRSQSAVGDSTAAMIHSTPGTIRSTPRRVGERERNLGEQERTVGEQAGTNGEQERIIGPRSPIFDDRERSNHRTEPTIRDQGGLVRHPGRRIRYTERTSAEQEQCRPAGGSSAARGGNVIPRRRNPRPAFRAAIFAGAEVVLHDQPLFCRCHAKDRHGSIHVVRWHGQNPREFPASQADSDSLGVQFAGSQMCRDLAAEPRDDHPTSDIRISVIQDAASLGAFFRHRIIESALLQLCVMAGTMRP